MFNLFHFLGFKGKHKEKPTVIVDFKLIDDTLHLSILNASHNSAYDVCVIFDHPLMGHNASKNITELAIVKNIPYLAPFKSVDLFIDPIEIFLSHLQHENYCIETHYKDSKNCHYKDVNNHNMKIYRELPNQTRIDFLIQEH